MRFDPDGTRLPIKVDSTSNGEFVPTALSRAAQAANRRAQEAVGQVARRLGLTRRDFLTRSTGAAATLLAFNEAHAAFGATGGRFALPAEAAYEQAAADSILADDAQLVFDMQLHCMDPAGDWAKGSDGRRWAQLLTHVSPQRQHCNATEEDFSCFSAEFLVREVFMDSDTDAGVVSAIWGRQGENPTPIAYAAEARALVAALEGPQRCLIQGGVLPNEPGALDFMDVQAREFGISAWKLYPQWGPDGVGYHMDDPAIGIPMIEKARETGVTIIAAHRGLSLAYFNPGSGDLATFDDAYADPRDIARCAAMYPDVTFICYHSGFEPGVVEGPYNADDPQGIDRLLHEALAHGLRRNEGNLYAELGALWRVKMADPQQAAHVMGKLLRYFGEERILWGTDCIWFGSPQDQIQAFRAFEISTEFQERFGYPALTPARKARILGLNAAALHGLDPDSMRKSGRDDAVNRRRRAYREAPDPSFLTYGPKTRRDFVRLLARGDGYP